MGSLPWIMRLVLLLLLLLLRAPRALLCPHFYCEDAEGHPRVVDVVVGLAAIRTEHDLLLLLLFLSSLFLFTDSGQQLGAHRVAPPVAGHAPSEGSGHLTQLHLPALAYVVSRRPAVGAHHSLRHRSVPAVSGMVTEVAAAVTCDVGTAACMRSSSLCINDDLTMTAEHA